MEYYNIEYCLSEYCCDHLNLTHLTHNVLLMPHLIQKSRITQSPCPRPWLLYSRP